MSSHLVNVRIDEERLRKVKALRKRGIVLSALVRTAIDERYAQTLSCREPRDVQAIFARLDKEYPITLKDLPPLRYDVHDRREAAATIRKRLGKRREKRRGR